VPDIERFRERRFGMFVHWGVYASAARNEWMRHREKTSDADYQRYPDHFDPDLYDPAAWVELAENAGMRYGVITAKHHDGYCLWPSEATDYRAPRDLIGPFLSALRDRGLGAGLYYSLIDWHHPQFPIDGLHPLRDHPPSETRDIAVYRDYLHGQVRDLLTRYGEIDQLFLDFSYVGHVHEGEVVWGGKGAADWGSADLLATIRDLQPGLLVNDRLDVPGDFVTPEQYQPSAGLTRDGKPVPWEACQTLNGSWGYDRDNHDFKTAGMLLRMLVDTVSKDGNLLLNVGPNARGEIDPEATGILRDIGRWMRLHQRAIYGAGPSTYAAPPDCRYTQRGDRLYMHLFAWPFEAVHLPGLAGRLAYAQFLHDGSEIRHEIADPDRQAYATSAGGQPHGTVTLELPVRRPDVEIPVIEIFLR
jgi:alpha-L-fucosidase